MTLTTRISAESSANQPKSRDVDWYHPDLTWLPETSAQLFAEYSGIPKDQILNHIHRIREKAWDVYPYPCIGVFRFIDFGAYNSPVYPSVVERIKAGQTFLDLGCCFGQDIRKLVYDGALSENLIGVDLHAGFHELGYELFRDRETLKARFQAQSIFDDDFLPELQGQIDIVYMGAFLHLFEPHQQKIIIRKVSKLLRDQKGSLAFGRHVGAEQAGQIGLNNKWYVYGHNDSTIQELFNGSGDGKWEVESQLRPFMHEGMDQKTRPEGYEERVRMMFFSASRL
ncbi:uncharacterized protein N7459_007604 [Penicillium hispanicum]|uniref:uncharacterized protein n=1 Tax=Penicillium hispanicum TaxID=1080232 RepID=UPI002540D9C8|nr:uncharacterized protein N7459_007604 [Penicillium hispanicum]KAJ5578640.1 hypothetical protein N7459_007604 [Penicillium hispanicum]